MALSRVAAHAVESGPDGEDLAAGAWQCLEAIALCAVTVAGNDRFIAVGQRIKRAGQANRHHPASLRRAVSLPSCRFMVDDLAEADRPSTPQLARNLPYRTYDLICYSVFESTIKTDFIYVASATWIAAATKAQRYRIVIC